MKVKTLVDRFEKFAPKKIAEKNDPVGLQIGSLDADVHKVMVTLDVRPEVVDEAIEKGVDFIFAHHPVMFRPAKNLDLSDPQNAMYAKIIANHITVYAAHTNLDSANGGLNDWLAETLGLEETTGLVPGVVEQVYLLTVQTPKVYSEAIRMSLEDAGGKLQLPDQDGYTFQWDGTTRLTTASNSSLPQTSSSQNDTRIEFEVPESNLTAVMMALKDVFPGDNPIYRLVKLEDSRLQYYMGRIGNLPESMTVLEFANKCKQDFNVAGLRVIAANLDQKVQRVAILGGDGGKFFRLAQQQGADVYVTGDVYYHTGHDMLASGLPVVDPGHHIEQIVKPKLTQLFIEWAIQSNWSIEVIASTINTDPFTFI
ncbi:Nif3-like dinuclear metal center hexameric protein [Lentilactobacillus senioris]|uniref:Nif3-like dinuclear metal center hexameric protein n=1 Tax=Lentilactobacillus senioris TaxID=931534 RepID=UPI003D2D58A2